MTEMPPPRDTPESENSAFAERSALLAHSRAGEFYR